MQKQAERRTHRPNSQTNIHFQASVENDKKKREAWEFEKIC